MSQRKAKRSAPVEVATEELNIDEINGRLQALAAQRNELANQVAVAHGKIAALQAHCAKLQQALDAAQAAKPAA